MAAAAGSLEGRNPDGSGFSEHLRRIAPGWRKDQPVLVLGAGGAARSVVVSLLDEGVPEIRLVNRTRQRAEALQALGPAVEGHDWPAGPAAVPDIRLLGNTTMLGLVVPAPLDIGLL